LQLVRVLCQRRCLRAPQSLVDTGYQDGAYIRDNAAVLGKVTIPLYDSTHRF
jgi:hypothetical protein